MSTECSQARGWSWATGDACSRWRVREFYSSQESQQFFQWVMTGGDGGRKLPGNGFQQKGLVLIAEMLWSFNGLAAASRGVFTSLFTRRSDRGRRSGPLLRLDRCGYCSGIISTEDFEMRTPSKCMCLICSGFILTASLAETRAAEDCRRCALPPHAADEVPPPPPTVVIAVVVSTVTPPGSRVVWPGDGRPVAASKLSMLG